MNKKKLFVYKSTVRIDDLNYGNHLCHSKFLTVMHNARALFLKQNNVSELDCFGVSLIMLSLNIDYKAQCFFDNKLITELYVGEYKKSTIDFKYSIYNQTKNILSASASTLMGFFDLEKQKLTKPSFQLIKLFNSLN